MLHVFIKGIGAGFAIAAPVGPVGVLCIRRTLAQGQWVGLASGMGAVAADTAYACLAGFGLHYIHQLLAEYGPWLQLALGLVLLAVGIDTFYAKARKSERPVSDAGTIVGAFASAFAITLANPFTFFAYLAVFSAFQFAAAPGGISEAFLVAAGAMLGSAVWWITLAIASSSFSHWFHSGHLVWINRIAGLVIGMFGLWALVDWAGLRLSGS